MAGPSLTRYTEIPISPFSGWDRVWQIETALAAHDFGNVRQSAILCDAMMRDDRISGVINTRIGSQLATDIDISPANPSTKARDIALEIGGDGSAPGLWPTMFPDSTIYQLQKYARLLGIVVGEIVWNTWDDGQQWRTMSPGVELAVATRPSKSKIRWTPRLRPWHPQFLYFDWAEFRWNLVAAEGVIPLPNTDDEPHSDGHWFIWAPYGYKYGWLSGLIRSLAIKYIARGWNQRDWARYNERHGLPILGLQVPAQQDKDVKDRVQAAVANIASETVIPLPVNEDGTKKYDLKVIEAVARSFDSFKLFKGELDTDIAIAVLGQNLTTEVKGGSRAAAEIQNQVRIDKRREDAAIAQALRDQVLWWYALYNFGDPNLAPVPEYMVEPPEDELAAGNALKAMGEGLKAMEEGAPGHLDVRAVLERKDLPILSQAEIEANQAIKAERQAQAFAAAGGDEDGGGGGGGGGGAPPFQRKQLPPAGGAAGKKDAGDRDAKPGKEKLGSSKPPIKRYEFQGLAIAVETPKGTTRVWTERNPDGTENIGATEMQHDYGYFEDQMGSDDEELDVYVGPDANAPEVHIIRQRRAPDFKTHDEDKVFMGFADGPAAKAAYLAHRNDGDRAYGGMVSLPLDIFKARLKRRTSSGKIHATAISNTVDALAALAARAPAEQLRVRVRRAGAKRYPDQLEQRAVNLAVRALAPDVAGLQAQIAKAKDFAEVRTLIIDYYGDKMSPERLAEIIRKTNTLSHLAGRFTAHQQV